MRPLADIGDVSKQDIQKQSRPKLPADGVLAMAKEVADLSSDN